MCDFEQRFYSEVIEDKQEPLSNTFEVTQCHCRNRKKSSKIQTFCFVQIRLKYTVG